MNTYYRIMINLIFIFFSFGILMPFLISAQDTVLVVLGLVYGLLFIPGVLYYVNKKFIISIMEKFK